ncbi:MAG TPA: HlyD family efflux transporter periplasmic adaptor subunit [Azospirillum sp.]|nr:HlyD family efflux transporter periplasmic adaptor subunit [Azospirillum sp.]
MSWISDLLTALAVSLGLASGIGTPMVHGYVEGEYLRVAAPIAATLDVLFVARGQTVAAGQPLFALDLTAAKAERARLAAGLGQARAQLADLLTGKRPEEVAVITAQKDQAEAALRYSEAELKRQEALVEARVSSPERLQAARSAFERDRARLAELVAQLAVSRLSARPDQIQAARDAAAMAEAALAQQDRRLAEMAPFAPTAALVDDTLYNPGEWVPAGSPVVSLLPPGGVKVIAFVPEPLMNRVKPGDRVGLRCDGCPPGLTARISFVSSRAEYTPPVIYSVGSREKLVFRIEAKPEDSAALNPGLPVDVELGR